MSTMTQDQVGQALANAGHYRVMQAQYLAAQGPADGISGELLLALGLRETKLRNVEGGAKKNADGKWVALSGESDRTRMDVGGLQISRFWHAPELTQLPAVVAGTWGPKIPGKNPMMLGYVPTWTHACEFTIRELREAIAYGLDQPGVNLEGAVRLGIAAHNCGLANALAGWRDGDIDKHTVYGNYSADVLDIRRQVNIWIADHPNWNYVAA